MPRRYTDEELTIAVKESYSMRAVLQKIGLTPAGGNYESVAKYIQILGLNTSHFLGQAILRGQSHEYGTRPIDDILVSGKIENTWRLKQRLLNEGLKEYRCEHCGGTEWSGQTIPLELHHINGNRTDNQ